MSDLFCAVSFSIDVELREARLAKECVLLCDELDFLTFDKNSDGLERAYAARSPRFKEVFPRVAGDEDPFAPFRKIFDDPNCPSLCVDVEFDDDGDEDSLVSLGLASRNAEVTDLANLIRTACSSALPTGFVFSTYSTKNQEGAANGGFALIRDDGVTLTWADHLLRDALKQAEPETSEPKVATLRRRPPMLRLVEDHVRSDVTNLVTDLAKGAQTTSLPRLTQQALALSETFVDFRQAAIENGWKFEDGSWRGYNWDEFDSWEKANDADRCETLRTAEDVCRENNLHPERYSITAFYAVSPWLAAKLIEKGERVDAGFAKLCVWARWWEASCDLVDDPVLQRIAAETERYQ